MFSYAVKHRTKKADIEARNDRGLSPLTLASKLGRFQLFGEIVQLQSCVSLLQRRLQNVDYSLWKWRV